MDDCQKNPARPHRIVFKDFSGKSFSLNTHISAWQPIPNFISDRTEGDLLLLGSAAGDLENLPFVSHALNNSHKIYWIEAPETLKQLAEKNLPFPPENESWEQVDLAWIQENSFNGKAYFYSPGRRLAPDFWNPLLAQVEIKTNKNIFFQNHSHHDNLVWLPGNDRQLLHQELQTALIEYGYTKIINALPETLSVQALEKLWNYSIPDFVLSINFRGLDPEGQIFAYCEALNIPLAIWLVDNPWNILSMVRYPWWKKANLFVTDSSFISTLRDYGARHVTHCPLATANHMWREVSKDFSKRPLFVGRSEFPEHQKYFGKIKIEQDLEKEAFLHLEEYQSYPDYHWWTKKFDMDLWPGKDGRKIAFYTDFFSAKNRAWWINMARESGLRIIGDPGWKKLLPDCEIEAPIDYYGKLNQIYGASGAVLNVTSLLLPASLNQRHFDVWAAGSMLFSNKTLGKNLFPEDLTQGIFLETPEEFPTKFSYWLNHGNQRKDLIMAWRELLKARHQYVHRIEFIKGTVAANASQSPLKPVLPVHTGTREV